MTTNDRQDPTGAPLQDLLPEPKNFRRSAFHSAHSAAGTVPAFIARASRLERAERRLLESLRATRRELLDGVLRGVKKLAALEGDDLAAAAAFPSPEAFLRIAAEVREHPDFDTRWVDTTPLSTRALARLREQLAERVARFNERWQHELASADLDALNAQIDGYNQYYPIEREMWRVYNSRRDFRPRPRWTPDALAAELPPLPDLGT